MSAVEKIRPYEHLTDAELNSLVSDAAELRLRLAMLSPGEVRETLIAYGCPPGRALNMVTDPMMKSYAAKFHLDCQDVLVHGDREAKERVEKVCEVWERLRAQEAGREGERA